MGVYLEGPKASTTAGRAYAIGTKKNPALRPGYSFGGGGALKDREQSFKRWRQSPSACLNALNVTRAYA
jgi:hypothetical protein